MSTNSNTATATPNVTSDGRTHVAVRRQRKPETLQIFWQNRLQPWLDLANLLPFTHTEQGFEPLMKLETHDAERLRDTFLKQFYKGDGEDWREEVRQTEAWFRADRVPIPVASRSLHPLASLAQDLADKPVYRQGQKARCVQRILEKARHEAEQRLTEIFERTRLFLEQLPRMTLPADATEEEWSKFAMAELPVVFQVGDQLGAGRITFFLDPLLDAFKSAFEGAEVARIRRCPVCGKFFYAIRANTGGCYEHLAYARVLRGRDPEVRRQYETTRQINRLVREGMSIAHAKAKVARKHRKRRTDR